MDNEQATIADRAEDAQTSIRESIERARELVCEARLAMRQREALKDEPPNPAS